MSRFESNIEQCRINLLKGYDEIRLRYEDLTRPKSDHASDQYDQRRRDNSSCHRAGRGNLGEAAVKLTSALLQFAGRKLPKEGSLGGQRRLDEACRFFA